MTLFYIIIASIVVALVSFSGRLFTLKKQGLTDAVLHFLMSFGVGIFLALVFFDLLPEALENGLSVDSLFLLFFGGILFFFFAERYLIWYHCHEEVCDLKMAKPALVLFGDAIHNFLDGTIIAITFMASLPLGIKTALAVMIHEVPQEIADFGALKALGLPLEKLFKYNFAVALTTLLGALFAYVFAPFFAQYTPHILTLIAGGFLYIAIADLIPEIHRVHPRGMIFFETVSLAAGIATIWLLAFLE